MSSFAGMLCAGGGLLPPALLDEARVPKFYLDALVACGGTSSSALPNTGLGEFHANTFINNQSSICFSL